MIVVTLTQSGIVWSEAVPVPASVSPQDYAALPSRTVFVGDGYVLDVSQETTDGFTYEQIVGRTIGEIRFLFPAESDADFRQVSVVVQGSGDFVVFGSPSFEDIFGGSGNDTIYDGEGSGGSGFSDRLYGGAGDDVYYVNSSDTDVYEAAGEGSDTIMASTFYDLRPGQRVETLRGVGYLGGNEFANTLIGADEEGDVLGGRGGADTLFGGAGADVLVGGADGDRLLGGSGADVFLFRDGESGADVIGDFGTDDVLVTTRAIRDSNGDGIVGFGGNRRFDLAAGASVAITDGSGRGVSALEYDGSFVEEGVTYYVYSRVGSAGSLGLAASAGLAEVAALIG